MAELHTLQTADQNKTPSTLFSLRLENTDTTWYCSFNQEEKKVKNKETIQKMLHIEFNQSGIQEIECL